METKEAGGFPHNLTKKELQDLCTKYGLSPYKAKFNPLNSRNSCIKSKDLRSISPLKRSRAHSTLLIPQLYSGALSGDLRDARTGALNRRSNAFTANSCENISCPKEEHKIEIHPQYVKGSLPGSCKGSHIYNEASNIEVSEEFVSSMSNIRRSSRIASKKKLTSLQNKLTSDRNDLKYRVKNVGMENVHQIRHRNINNGACPVGSASDFPMTSLVPYFEFHVRSEEGIKLFVDLNSSSLDWSKSLENEVCFCQNMQKNKFQSFRQELEYLGNSNKRIKSSFLWNMDLESRKNNDSEQIDFSSHSTEGRTGHLELDQVDKSEGKSMVSNVSYDPPLTFAWDSGVNLTSGLSTSEDQSSKLDDENFGNIYLPNACNLGNLSAAYPGWSVIDTVEMQQAGVANNQKDISCSPSENNAVHNAEIKDNRVDSSSEVNHDGLRKYATEEWERSNSVNGSTQFSSTLEKGSEDLSDGKHKRKRNDNVFADDYGQNDGRILRSMKHFGGQFLPRRSMRLVSK